MSLKNPEFPVKRLVRFVMRKLRLPEVQTDDEFLKKLNEIGDLLIAAEKKGDEAIKQILANAKNFAVTLGLNDEAWRKRLILAVWLIQQTDFSFEATDIEWCKAHLTRAVYNELENHRV